MLKISSSGDTNDTNSFLKRCMSDSPIEAATKFAQEGVQRLRDATPEESGLTASMWSYEIVSERGGVTIWFRNGNIVDGFSVAVGLQYGHGTGNGGYVNGQDYMNPALQPIFDKMANAAWKEVTK